MRRLLNSQATEVIVSSCLGSLGLYILDEDALRIAKIVIFSRAVTNGVHLLGEVTGLYKPVESSKDGRKFTVESLFALAASTYLGYAFSFDSYALPVSFRNQFIAGANMDLNEKMFFDSWRAVREIELRMRKR